MLSVVYVKLKKEDGSRRQAERQIVVAIDRLFPPVANDTNRDIIVHYNDHTAQCYQDIRYVLLMARADIMKSHNQFELVKLGKNMLL